MKLLLFVALTLMLLVPTAAADPLPPVNGLYNSVTQGGTFRDGHFSESWVGGEGQIGNTIHAQSWDGLTLGAEWKIWCASILLPPSLQSDTRDGNGTGQVTYETIYGGGMFWLSKNGPWSADNLVDFTGTIQMFVVTSTHEYVFGTRIGVRANITVSGLFDQQYQTWGQPCMDYLITNSSILGSTDVGPFDPNFPGLLDANACPSDLPGLLTGSWGDVTHVSLFITGCVVPVEDVSWGGIKSIYSQ